MKEIREFHGFIRGNAHVLSRWPGALFELAANTFQESSVALKALERWEQGLEGRPWLQQLDGRPSVDLCLLTIIPAYRTVTMCVFSPDGRQILGASSEAILVWDVETGKEVNRLRTKTGGVTHLAFAVGGTRLVTSDGSPTLTIWDWLAWSEVASLTGHQRSVNALAVSSDGEYLLSSAEGWDEPGELFVWNLPRARQAGMRFEEGGFMLAGGFSPDGSLVLASEQKAVTLWRSRDGQRVKSLAGHTDDVETCRFSHDGKRIISGARDQTLIIWNPRKQKPLLRLQGHAGPVWSCAIAPDDRHVVSASEDRTLKVWDMRSGKMIADLPGHEQPVRWCAFSPDGTRIVSVDAGSIVRVWATPQTSSSTQLPWSRWPTCEYAPDGDRVVVCRDGNTLVVSDQYTGAQLAEVAGRPRRRDPRAFDASQVLHQVTSCRFSPDGKLLAVAERDDWYEGNGITILSGETYDELCYLHVGNGHAMGELQFTEDGCRLLGGMVEPPRRLLSRAVLHSGWAGALVDAGDVRIWDPSMGRETGQLTGHRHYVSSLRVSPDGRWCVSACLTTARVWDMELALETMHHDHASDKLLYAAFTPDGCHVVVWTMWDMRMVEHRGDPATLKVLGLPDGVVHMSFVWESLTIHACCIAPDGRWIYVAMSDGTIRALDLAGRKEAHCWRSAGRIHQLSCTPDGHHLCVAYEDGNLAVTSASGFAETAVLHAAGQKNLRIVSGHVRDGNSAGEFVLSGVRYRPMGFSLSPPLLTAVYLYSYAREDWGSAPSVRCPRCLHRFVPPSNALSAIAEMSRNLQVNAGSSVCLESRKEAWENPLLAIQCSRCSAPIALNPFIADGRGRAPTGPFPGRTRNSHESSERQPGSRRRAWWRVWRWS